MKRTCLLMFLIISSLSLFSQTLIVEVSGIRNKDGLIRLAFFKDESSFRAEQPLLSRAFEKADVLNGNLTVQLDSVQPGTYGIALLDDENRNGKLDYRLIIPREGIGFSNYVQHSILRPVFSDFSFILKKNVTIRIPIRLTYY